MDTNKFGVVEYLYKDEVVCFDEDFVACLYEGLLSCLDKNNKDFYVGFLLPRPL